jgi:hypothetical protein
MARQSDSITKRKVSKSKLGKDRGFVVFMFCFIRQILSMKFRLASNF